MVPSDNQTAPNNSDMKMLGLVGGTSWHSTVEYYSTINQLVNEHFGNNTNPPLMMYNINQALVHRYQNEDNWDGVADLFLQASTCLEQAGVDAVMFCANTPHKIFPAVNQKLSVPMLHIADATAAAIHQSEIRSVCFIGTKFSMQQDFVTGRIAEHEIDVLVPQDNDVVNELHRIIQKELTFGEVKSTSKAFVIQELNAMISRGAKGVVLGCTEFPLMISAEDLNVPIFNTTHIHSQAAANFVLQRIH